MRWKITPIFKYEGIEIKIAQREILFIKNTYKNVDFEYYKRIKTAIHSQQISPLEFDDIVRLYDMERYTGVVIVNDKNDLRYERIAKKYPNMIIVSNKILVDNLNAKLSNFQTDFQNKYIVAFISKKDMNADSLTYALRNGETVFTFCNSNPYIKTEDFSWQNSLLPKIVSIEVDNYQGIITVIADRVNRIEWLSDGELAQKKYNLKGTFVTKFKVENLDGKYVEFKLIGNGGIVFSQLFSLQKI